MVSVSFMHSYMCVSTSSHTPRHTLAEYTQYSSCHCTCLFLALLHPELSPTRPYDRLAAPPTAVHLRQHTLLGAGRLVACQCRRLLLQRCLSLDQRHLDRL
jgi:hypothetical protein